MDKQLSIVGSPKYGSYNHLPFSCDTDIEEGVTSKLGNPNLKKRKECETPNETVICSVSDPFYFDTDPDPSLDPFPMITDPDPR